jgi:hypothetical protein
MYLVTICNLRHLTRREYKGKIYIKNIRKNSCRIPKKSFRIQNTGTGTVRQARPLKSTYSDWYSDKEEKLFEQIG